MIATSQIRYLIISICHAEGQPQTSHRLHNRRIRLEGGTNLQCPVLVECINKIRHSYFLSFPIKNLSTDRCRCLFFFQWYHFLCQIVQTCLAPQTGSVPIPVIIIRSRTEQAQSDWCSQQFLSIQSQGRKCPGILVHNESCFSRLLRTISRRILITGKYKLVVCHFPVGIH